MRRTEDKQNDSLITQVEMCLDWHIKYQETNSTSSGVEA